MQVFPIISGQLSETGVRRMLDRGQSEVRGSSEKESGLENKVECRSKCKKCKEMRRNAIIRLGCIKEDTEFKYKRFGKLGARAEEDIRE